jgi:hypothetical protein
MRGGRGLGKNFTFVPVESGGSIHMRHRPEAQKKKPEWFAQRLNQWLTDVIQSGNPVRYRPLAYHSSSKFAKTLDSLRFGEKGALKRLRQLCHTGGMHSVCYRRWQSGGEARGEKEAWTIVCQAGKPHGPGKSHRWFQGPNVKLSKRQSARWRERCKARMAAPPGV